MHFLSILIYLIVKLNLALTVVKRGGIERAFPSSVANRVAVSDGLELNNLRGPRIK